VVDGKEETQLITDSLHLQIHFFEDFEINKPAYKGAYSIDSLTFENTENLSKSVKDDIYKLKPEFKYPVKEFRSIVGGGYNTTLIDATSKVKNLLTSITKNLVVESDSLVFKKYTYTIKEEMQGSEPTTTKIILERIP
jgi:hypothetical protein